MSEPAPRPPMLADEFIAWAMQQPETEHYELFAGQVFAMAPERAAHALAKFRIARRLAEAIEAAGLPCTVYPDGMQVEVDAQTVYGPDALVRCGPLLPPDTVRVRDPLIIVEVLSPSTHTVDRGVKFTDYFRIPSVRHYVLALADRPVIVHHARDEDGRITSRILGEGTLRLDPPGIELDGIFA